jgi:hypothetical protein
LLSMTQAHASIPTVATHPVWVLRHAKSLC